LESTLARHRRLVWFALFRQGQALSTFGWQVIGIRWEGITSGTQVIGLGPRIPALAGWSLTTMEGSILRVTGRESAAESNMTTALTATKTGIIESGNTTRQSEPRSVIGFRSSESGIRNRICSQP